MIPAASCFDPFPIKAVGAGLRAARFAADPAAAPRGTCVLLHGQTEFIEKYFEVIDELRGRGFAVATFDWRGQGGSDRLLSDDSRKSFIGDFSAYDEDLDTLMNWVVRPMLGAGEKPVALAHSMGAHNLLRYLVQNPGSFGPCVLNAPMIAISLRGQKNWLVKSVVALEMRRGNGAGWVGGMENRDPFSVTFQTQIVTSDPQRFERTQMLLRENPDLRLAGATWSWLGAAMRAMAWLRAPGRAEHIDTPMLVIGAGADKICLTGEAKAFAARMPNAAYLEIPEAGHEVLMERNVYRAQFWSAFDAFMQKHRAPV